MTGIYISSTYEDLKEYRRAVSDALRKSGNSVVGMEDYAAADERPLDRCLADVERCDVYVGIFAWRYGYIPPQEESPPKSITELEYRKAGESGKTRLIFLLDQDTAWSRAKMDEVTGEGERGGRIAALREELDQTHVRGQFRSPDDLAKQVLAAVEFARASPDVDRKRLEQLADTLTKGYLRHIHPTGEEQRPEPGCDRYIPLRLQDVRPQGDVPPSTSHVSPPGMTPAGSPPATGTPQPAQTTVQSGTWRDLIHYPDAILLMGSGGSGKTTLLLHEAQRMAQEALADETAPIPIYLLLNTCMDGDEETLFRRMDHYSGLERDLLRKLWYGRGRRLCLLMDAFDEVPRAQAEALIDTIGDLWSRCELNRHSIVLACRPDTGPSDSTQYKLAFQSAGVQFRVVALTSLSDSDIDDFLDRYGAPTLSETLTPRMRELVQNPGSLAELVQSYRENPNQLPRHVGKIREFVLEDQLLRKVKSPYSYEHVLRPVLAELGYQMMTQSEDSPLSGDLLYQFVRERLEQRHELYHRRRSVMPEDWSGEALLRELLQSRVLERAASDDRIMFSKRWYRDYFAAVHIDARGLDSPEFERIVADPQNDLWYEVLVNLMGIQDESEPLFTCLYARNPNLATQLWFENGPGDGSVPRTVKSAFRAESAAVATPCPIRTDDLSGQRLLSLLSPLLDDSNSPHVRLRAAAMLTQLGSPGAPLLIKAARDPHSLVRAVASYALMHVGEPKHPEDSAEPNRPMPPLLEIEGRRFWFRSNGGCCASIGPLQLIDVPNPAAVHLTLEIDDLDFDPFDEELEVRITHRHTAPSLLAAYQFEAQNVMDWMRLTARCQWIAEQSQKLACDAEAFPDLANLAAELHYRAVRYYVFGKHLADDLRTPWDLPDPQPPNADAAKLIASKKATIDAISGNYQNTRRLYNHTNRSALLVTPSLGGASEDRGSDIGIQAHTDMSASTDLTTGDIAGDVTGLHVMEIHIHQDEAYSGADGSSLVHLQVERAAGQLRGSLTGVEIGTLHGAHDQVPLALRIQSSLSVAEATASTITGLVVHRMLAPKRGWTAAANIKVGTCRDSAIRGIVVEQYERNPAEESAHETTER